MRSGLKNTDVACEHLKPLKPLKSQNHIRERETMDHIAAAEEQIVTERLRRKLEEVNVSAQSQLSPIQDHINFTLQVCSCSPSLGTNCEKNSPESEEKGLILVKIHLF